jgi:hypothetical protein
MAATKKQGFERNHIRGKWITSNQGLTLYGHGAFLCNSAPYLFQNDIATEQYGVVSEIGGNSAVLACNLIDSCEYGVLSQPLVPKATDKISMNRVWFQANTPAVNTVQNGRSADIWMYAPGILLDSGQNSIIKAAGPLANYVSNAGAGGAFASTGYNARLNYWGADPMPEGSCGGGWQNGPWNHSPDTSQCDCQADGIAHNIGRNDSLDCAYWSTAYEGQSGHFSVACDSLLARYNAKMACGDCDTALSALYGAMQNCGNESQQELRDLPKRVLATVVSCHGQDCDYLQPVATFFLDDASNADSVYAQHAAMWMYAQTPHAMRSFDSAATSFENIASENWAMPEDSATAHEFTAQARHVRDVEEGSNPCPSGLGKVRTVNKGRAGLQPTGTDPLSLTASPKPVRRSRSGCTVRHSR